jgi:hypothetical protein
MLWKTRNLYKTLAGEPHMKRLLGRHSKKKKDNIKIAMKIGTSLNWLNKGTDGEYLGSIKTGYF